MPNWLSDGKGPDELPTFLEPAEHAVINHDGLPGVMSTATHAGINHAGLPGVGDLSVAAHAALDHSAITGVGLRGTQVLAPGVSQAQIQAALNHSGTYVVFLLPGDYSIGSSVNIHIPNSKSLIGLGGAIQRHNISPSFSTSTHVVFTVATHASGSNAYFRMESGSKLKNIVIRNGSGANSANAIDTVSGCTIEDIIISDWMISGTTSGGAINATNGTIVRNVLVYRAKNYGFVSNNSNGGRPVVFEHCVAYDCDNSGFRLTNASHLVDCYSFANTGSGFVGVSGCTHQKLTNCTAESNSVDGFNWTASSAGDGTLILGCFAITNSVWGFNLTAATPNRPGIHSCSGRGNVSGNFNVGGGWQTFSLWNG